MKAETGAQRRGEGVWKGTCLRHPFFSETNELPQVGHIMLLLVSAVYTFPRILGRSLSPA